MRYLRRARGEFDKPEEITEEKWLAFAADYVYDVELAKEQGFHSRMYDYWIEEA